MRVYRPEQHRKRRSSFQNRMSKNESKGDEIVVNRPCSHYRRCQLPAHHLFLNTLSVVGALKNAIHSAASSSSSRVILLVVIVLYCIGTAATSGRCKGRPADRISQRPVLQCGSRPKVAESDNATRPDRTKRMPVTWSCQVNLTTSIVVLMAAGCNDYGR